MCQEEELVAAGLEQSVGFAVNQAKLLSGSGVNFAAGPGQIWNILVRKFTDLGQEMKLVVVLLVFKVGMSVCVTEPQNILNKPKIKCFKYITTT